MKNRPPKSNAILNKIQSYTEAPEEYIILAFKATLDSGLLAVTENVAGVQINDLSY